MLLFDTSLFLSLNATAASPDWLVKLALFSTQQLPAWLIAGAVGAFLVGDQKTRAHVIRVFVAMAAAWLLARIGQHLISAPRPFSLGLGKQWIEHGNSAGFPSTHASVAFAFGLSVAIAVRHWAIATFALLLASLIAWGRICLGLHFPSDALAGAAVGLIATLASAWVPKRAMSMQANTPRTAT